MLFSIFTDFEVSDSKLFNMNVYHTIIAGLGAVGSAALYQLSKRGYNVLGIDRFKPPHSYGSSHGDTRITRQAIGEGAEYTPLSLRSYEIWEEIEKQINAKVLHKCGGLILSGQTNVAAMHGTRFFENTVDAAQLYNIPHQILTAQEVRRKFPQFIVSDTDKAYYEPSAGYLVPERCIRANLRLATAAGAEVQFNDPVIDVNTQGDLIQVRTEKGSFVCEHLILATGAWLPGMTTVPEFSSLNVYRQVMTWFAPKEKVTMYGQEHCPVFIWERANKSLPLYGFPMVDEHGVKICTEFFDETCTPETVQREVHPESYEWLYEELVDGYFRAIQPECTRATACLYTVEPEFKFKIERHPECSRVMLASACSGHGFKHAAAIGEQLCMMVLS
jgi:sarcosine oxidase